MWYKFYANHGPGHQGYTEDYFYISGILSDDDRRAYWDNWVYRFDYPIGDIEPVDKLPEKIRLEKIEYYQSNIKSCKFMLKQLGVDNECSE